MKLSAFALSYGLARRPIDPDQSMLDEELAIGLGSVLGAAIGPVHATVASAECRPAGWSQGVWWSGRRRRRVEKADLPARAVFRLVQAKVPCSAGWVAAMAIKRFLSHLAASGMHLKSRGGVHIGATKLGTNRFLPGRQLKSAMGSNGSLQFCKQSMGSTEGNLSSPLNHLESVRGL